MAPRRRIIGLAGAASLVMASAGTAAASAAPNTYTVAGTGASGFSGDGGSATMARIDGPRAVAWMPDGGFVFADFRNARVRRVWPDGTIRTVAGDGVNGYNGDGRLAAGARLNLVHGVAAMPDGGFLIDDPENQRIRRVWPNGTATTDDDTITTVAGSGVGGYRGDGGLPLLPRSTLLAASRRREAAGS
jgi:serine/threonine-protein kinase